MNVLVCCSSQSPDNAIFEFAEEAAKEIAEFIVRGNHNLVFGGGKTGLMIRYGICATGGCRGLMMWRKKTVLPR